MKSRSDLMQQCYRDRRQEAAILNRRSVSRATRIQRIGAVSLCSPGDGRPTQTSTRKTVPGARFSRCFQTCHVA